MIPGSICRNEGMKEEACTAEREGKIIYWYAYHFISLWNETAEDQTRYLLSAKYTVYIWAMGPLMML